MQLRRDKRGSIAINFTLALIPITLAVGGAVDYSVANRIKAELDAAADAAALSAVSKTGVRERDADRVGPVPDGDLHLRHDNNDQCTDSNGALSGVNSVITTPGDGSVAATPQKIVFLVSDGVADAYYPSTCSKTTTSGRCQQPYDLSYCATLKSRGITIAALYTTYLAAADQRLVQHVDCAVAGLDWHQHAELRLARALFRSEPHTGHFRRDDGPVPEGRGAGASDKISTPTINSFLAGCFPQQSPAVGPFCATL